MNAVRFYRAVVLVLLCAVFLCFGSAMLVSSTSIFNFSVSSEETVRKIAGFLGNELFVPVRFTAVNLRASKNEKQPLIGKYSLTVSLNPIDEKKVIFGYGKSINFGHLLIAAMTDSMDIGKKQRKKPCLGKCLVYHYVIQLTPKIRPDINDLMMGNLITVVAKSTFVFQEKYETESEWQYFLSEKIVEKLDFQKRAIAKFTVIAGVAFFALTFWPLVTALVEIKRLARLRKAGI